MRTDSIGRRRSVMPPAPRTLDEAGLSFDGVMQLVVKLLHLAGELSGAELGERLGRLEADPGAAAGHERGAARQVEELPDVHRVARRERVPGRRAGCGSARRAAAGRRRSSRAPGRTG